MSISILYLVLLLFFLPGLAFLAGGRRPLERLGITDMLFLSVALSGWAAQTLALAGWFTVPVITSAVLLLSAALLFRHGARNGLVGIRRVRFIATPPTAAHLLAGLALVLLALLIYRPPGVGLLGGAPAPAFHGLGIHLARTGALPQAEPASGLAGAGQAMRSTAGPGLFFQAWIGLLQFMGGNSWSAAASVLFVCLSLAAAFRLARKATGSAMFGVGLLVVLGVNYPQVWLARVSVPEAAAQFLVLSSALFFLRAREGYPGILAASLTLGAAALCAPGLLHIISLALLLLLALHAVGPPDQRRLAALYSLGVLPFLAQGWLQSILLGHGTALQPVLQAALAFGILLLMALVFLHTAVPGGRPIFISWTLFTMIWAVWLLFSMAETPESSGGSLHWMIWYLTLPFMVLLCGGLLELLARPRESLRLVSGLGPLFPMALVSASLILLAPGPKIPQPWATRPFTVTLVPLSLLLGLYFFHRMLGRLRHPALRMVWCSCLAVMLGLNLANLLPMATARPGHGADPLVKQVVTPLTGGERPFTVVVEPGPGSMGLHSALEGIHGLEAVALRGEAQDRQHFHQLVRDRAAAGLRTALVIAEGSFTPAPDQVQLNPMATAAGELRLLPPEAGHMPSSVVTRNMDLQLFEAVPLPEPVGHPGPDSPVLRGPLTVNVGTYREDWPWLQRGFLGITSAGGRTFRWTGGLSVIRVPDWAQQVELTVGGFRPPGASGASVTAGFSGYPAQVTRVLPRRGFITISLVRPGGTPAPLLLELRSTRFRPDPWFTDWDGEPRGLQLSEITFHPSPESVSRTTPDH